MLALVTCGIMLTRVCPPPGRVIHRRMSFLRVRVSSTDSGCRTVSDLIRTKISSNSVQGFEIENQKGIILQHKLIFVFFLLVRKKTIVFKIGFVVGQRILSS